MTTLLKRNRDVESLEIAAGWPDALTGAALSGSPGGWRPSTSNAVGVPHLSEMAASHQSVGDRFR
jgi:hypothetical protein